MSDLTTTFTNIANAIRSKTGSSDTMTPSEMPDEIAGIETPMDSINITQNGTYEPSEGRGYNQVIVEVPAPTLKTKSITANGTYSASADNADGYSQVTVAVEGFKKKSIANTPKDIASFDDGTANPMPSLEISIEPQQDLHGYDYPWVGGAGKNKQMTPIEENVVYRNGGNLFTLAFNNGVITFTVTGTGSTFFDITAFEIKSEHVGKTYTMSYDSSPSLEDNYCIFETWDGTTRVSLNSSTVTITNDLVGKWLCCRYYKYGTGTYTISKCQVEERQTATSYAPYENICPISGHTEANVTRCGKNLFDKTKGTDNFYIGDNGSTVRNVGWHISDFIKVKGDITYHGITNTGNAPYSAFYDHNKALIQVFKQNTGENTISTLSGAEYVRFSIDKNAGDMDSFMVELGSSATAYSPYQGSTTSIPFHDSSDNPITVYGGTLNVTSGELTATHANIASYNGETINEPWISSMDVYSAGATPTTGAQVVYPLATPQTYQLTPTQVTTLLGQNNIFADCGQILDGEYFVTL